MPEDLRWRMEEVHARFALEPTLNDLFVEGIFDKEVLSRCLSGRGEHTRVIYEIDSVDVPASLLTLHKLTDGNKQRVIALARELATIEEDCSYRCLVDRDLDHWFGELETTPRLRWTSHCSLELYFFEDAVLRDILITTAKSTIKDWKLYRGSLEKTLRSLYALRLADRHLGLGLTWIPYAKLMTRQGQQIAFNAPEYVKRLLISNNKSKQLESFKREVKSWGEKLKGDVRLFIRGHDLVALLSWTIQNFGGIKDLSSTLAIERLFVLLSPQIPDFNHLLDS